MDWVTQAFSVYSALGLGLIGTVIAILIIIVLISWAIYWFLLPFYVRHISKTLEVFDIESLGGPIRLLLETLMIIKRQQERTNELLVQIIEGSPPPNNIKKDEPKIKSQPSGMIIVPKGRK